MTTWLRRLFWLGLLAGVGCAVATALKRRNEPAAATTQSGGTTAPTAAPSVAPRTAFTEIEADVPPADDAAAGAQRWRDPVDGGCPPGHPIKANAKSEIYHVPGGRFYDRTIPERCYATAEDAEADGYRRSKA
jgi:hypothetical protein